MTDRWVSPIATLLARLGQRSPIGAFPVGAAAPLSAGAVWGLTGAAGWWGRHFARALLSADPRATLVVPVRAANREGALARLHAAWMPSESWRQQAATERWWQRTHVLALASLDAPPDLGGLRPWKGLDTVVHAAADTSLALTVDQAWATNVVGTQNAWNWAVAGGARRFDHISTLSVWVAAQTPPGVLLETDALDQAGRVWGGYAASKWAAEAWLAGRSAGPSVAVHRLGLISHSAGEGWAPLDPLALTARAWARWGRPPWLAPRSSEKVDWSPVEHTVAGVLAVARAGAVGPFHWASRQAIPASAWLEALERRFGTSPGDWPPDDGLGRAARRAFGRWSHPERARRLWWHDAFQSDRHRFAADRAASHLPRWNWSPGELDAALAHPSLSPDF